MGGDTYVNVTVYRGGTLDNPTLVIDDLEYVSVKQLLGIAASFEVRSLNWYDDYTDAVHGGDIISISFGNNEDDAVEILRGRVFNVQYPEDTILLTGQDWTFFVIGTKVTKRYGNYDYGYIFQNLLEEHVPNLKTNFVLTTGITSQKRYSGAYKELLYILNEIADEPGFEWRVRNDREAILFPDGLQVQFIDAFRQEADLEDPDGWTEQLGTWYVSDQKYYGEVVATHALATTDIATSSYQDIRTIYNMNTGLGMYILFDFNSTTNFKYILFDDNSDLIIIGHYDGSFNTDNSTAETLDEDTDYRIRVVIDGLLVTVYMWNTSTEVWDSKVSYTFGSIDTGTIGVGVRGAPTKNGTFDDFAIYTKGQLTLDSDEFLAHDIARRDFRDLINKQTVVGGTLQLHDKFETDLYEWGTIYNEDQGTVAIDSELQLLEMEETVATSEIRIWSNDTYKDITIDAKGIIDADGTDDNFCLLYRSEDETHYYKVKFDADANTVTLLVNAGGGESTIKTVTGVTITTGTEYTFGVKALDYTHKAYLNGVVIYDVGDDTIIVSGRAGIGIEDAHIYCSEFTLTSSRIVVASASDPSLYDVWGIKSGEVIRDRDIRTRSQGLARAQYELDLNRFLKTRGLIKDEGRTDIVIGDVHLLNIPESAISNVNYMIYGVQQLFDMEKEDGWVTIYSVAEDLPRMEDIIKRVIYIQADIIHGLIDTTQLTTSSTQSLDTLYYYESIYKTLYTLFKIDYIYMDFWTVS